MTPSRTAGFHHVALVTRDTSRALAFYQGLLGFSLLKRSRESDDPGGYHLCLGDEAGRPGTLLAFLEWPHAGRGRPGIGGVHHLALGVGSDEGLLKWKRRLVDAGIPVSGPYDRGYFTSLYFRDPDGQIVEIATAGPGYAIDEPEDALGRELLLPPQRIVRGYRDEAAIARLTHPEPVPGITPDMALQGLHHISGITDDLARAGDFFESALGLKLIKKTINRDDPGQLHYFWGSYDGGQIEPHSSLTLFGWPPAWNRTRGGIGQMHRVSFRAADAEELSAWQDHLRAQEIEVSQMVDRGAFRSIYFRAPDGMLLEIATDGPGYLAAR